MFEVEQTYDLTALTALCRAARKTVRMFARAWRIVCWCILGVGAALFALLIAFGGMPDFWMWAVLLALLVLLLTEDRLNAWIALKQMVPGTAHSTTVFADDVYTVTTDTTETKYQYENITALRETEGYFLFFLGKRHGQVFDKNCFQEGEPDAFRTFIEQKTGMTFVKTK